MRFQVRCATIADLPAVAALFDSYRQFYEQAPDYLLSEAFIRDRLVGRDSVVFLAFDSERGTGLGFAQLYPSFSSVAAQRIWILNDLFVTPDSRGRGVGRALLEATKEHGLATRAKRLVLSTAVTNQAAQSLYESFGYKQEKAFVEYTLEL